MSLAIGQLRVMIEHPLQQGRTRTRAAADKDDRVSRSGSVSHCIATLGPLGNNGKLDCPALPARLLFAEPFGVASLLRDQLLMAAGFDHLP